MNIRKMAGLFLIIMGLINVFRALSAHMPADTLSRPHYAFVTALLFAGGAALIWWKGKWWNNSKTHG